MIEHVHAQKIHAALQSLGHPPQGFELSKIWKLQIQKCF